MTQYENDTQEHLFGRYGVRLNGNIITRYYEELPAKLHVARLRKKIYGRGAKVVDGGEQQ